MVPFADVTPCECAKRDAVYTPTLDVSKQYVRTEVIECVVWLLKKKLAVCSEQCKKEGTFVTNKRKRN